jgi:cobalt/nickel transport system permease protein
MKDWHAAEVLTLSLGLLLAAQIAGGLAAELCIFGVAAAVMLGSRSMPMKRWLLFVLTPVGFLLPSTLFAALSYRPGYALWNSFYFDGALLHRAERAALRSLVSVCCTLLLLGARTPAEWAAEFPRGGYSRFLGDLLVLMERYSLMLKDAARAIQKAQAARLAEISYRRKTVSFALLCASLIMRAELRATRLQDAMDARLYQGEIRLKKRVCRLRVWRLGLIIALLCALLAAGRAA